MSNQSTQSEESKAMTWEQIEAEIRKLPDSVKRKPARLSANGQENNIVGVDRVVLDGDETFLAGTGNLIGSNR